MVTGKLHPKDLIIWANNSGDLLMKNALLSTTLSNINKSNQTLMQS